MSGELKRASHLDFTPLGFSVTEGGVCGVCRTAGAESNCERCDASLHGECYWDSVAAAWELEHIEAGLDDVILLCPGCRS